MLYLPVIPSVAHYDFDIAIGRATYNFEFLWNERGRGAWYFNVSAFDGAPIALGVKVALGAPLARTVHHPLVTDGALIAYDREGSARGQGRSPAFDDFGTRVLLAHVTSFELAALILAKAAA